MKKVKKKIETISLYKMKKVRGRQRLKGKTFHDPSLMQLKQQQQQQCYAT
jgi:hypothetical protein